MVGYIPYPIEVDIDAIVGQILDGIASRIPGWTPGGEGTLEVALAEEIGRAVGDLHLGIQNRAANDFIFLGGRLFNVASLPGATATLPVLVTLARSNSTIPAGFTVIGTTTDGVDVAFQLEAARTTGAATSIPLVLTAVTEGEASNGVPVGDLRIVTSTEAVTVVEATAESFGGVDPETADEYLDRLVTTIGTLTRTPILPRDFAIRSQDVNGVHRALAVNGYNPADQTTNNQRFITVFPIDEYGAPVSTAVRNELIALLDDLREVNFEVRAASPTYTPIHVQFTAVAENGYIPADVQAAVIAKGKELVSPATFAGGDQEPPEWNGDKTLRYLDIARQLGSVDGVAYLTALTINGAAADVTLTGVAALPASTTAPTNPSTVNGVVS